MKGFAVLAVLAAAGFAMGQGVIDKIAPKEKAPAGCKTTFSGLFQVTVEDVTLSTGKKRDLNNLKKRGSCAADGTLVVGLADGVLLDSKSRTGYIADNRQFQFDGPPQAGAIFTAGFSVCGNNSLALGDSTVWYQCASGDFYNLYDRHWAPQCSPVEIVALPCGGTDSIGQIPDGQIVGTTIVATTVVIPLSDGQPQVITTSVPIPVCQINDGQIQGKTTPCASITPVTKPTAAPVPVSQYSDGQIQVTPGGGAPPPPATTAATSQTPASQPPAPPVSSASKPSASAPGVGSNTTTLAASKTSAPAPPASSSSSAPGPSAPANSAGNIQMSSLAALAVGIVGAVCFL